MERLTDLLPVIVAITALMACSRQFLFERRSHERVTMLIGVLSSLMYIGLSLYWYWHYDIRGDSSTSVWENFAWTIANSVALSGFIHMAMGRRIKP